ncbi:MAG: SRPBCC family protein [Flavobacteriales bacterium]
MRVLKTILIILLALGGIVLLLGLIGPPNYRVERSTTIAAPVDVVFDQVSHLSNMREWGPWQAMDKDQVQSLEGTDGTVGAVWKWEGDTVGVGQQEITALDENKSVRTKLTFVMPVVGEMVSTGTFDLVPLGDSTKVIWGMEGENGFLGKLMSKFSDRDAMLGPMFDSGLANLKSIAEAQAQAVATKNEYGGYEIATVEWPETVYIGKRNKKLKWSEFESFYGASFGGAASAIGKAKLEITGSPSGVYFAWNETDQTADVLAGMPVKAASNMNIPGFETHVIPACKMLKVAYYGHMSRVVRPTRRSMP